MYELEVLVATKQSALHFDGKSMPRIVVNVTWNRRNHHHYDHNESKSKYQILCQMSLSYNIVKCQILVFIVFLYWIKCAQL
jgi:hypothetical protein